MLTKAELPDCPVATTVQLIGNKWKLLILRNLQARPWRFNEMLHSIPGISQKVLTDNLRALEKDGIITRTGLHCSPLIHSYIGSSPRGTVRISFSPFTTAEDVTALASALKEIL